MKVLSDSQFRDWMIATGWLACSERSVEALVPAVLYTGGCATDGYAASDVADFLLRGIVDAAGGSGALWVFDISPADEPPLEVFRLLTAAFGAPAAKPAAWQFEFSDEPGAALCAVSWCLACGWSFYFVHQSARCFFTMHDERLQVCVGREQNLKADAEAWLLNCDFKMAMLASSLPRQDGRNPT